MSPCNTPNTAELFPDDTNPLSQVNNRFSKNKYDKPMKDNRLFPSCPSHFWFCQSPHFGGFLQGLQWFDTYNKRKHKIAKSLIIPGYPCRQLGQYLRLLICGNISHSSWQHACGMWLDIISGCVWSVWSCLYKVLEILLVLHTHILFYMRPNINTLNLLTFSSKLY